MSAQQISLNKLLKVIEKKYNEEKYKELLLEVVKEDSFKLKSTKDSLLFSKIIHLKANALYQLGDYKKTILFYNIAINNTPNSETGKNQKGIILFDRAFAEYYLQQYTKSYKTVKKAEQILSALENPDYDCLLSIYADISGTSTYYGFFEEAEYYIKKGLKIYQLKYKKSKVKNTNQASKEVIFKHKLVYLYSRKGDELKMLEALKEFESLKSEKRFNDKEQRLFAISLNHVGDFYLNFRDKLKQKLPLQKGKEYLLKAIDVLNIKKHPDDLIEIKFNLVKQLRYSKEFEKALKESRKMIDLAKADDFRAPFFYAQRGIIYAESGDKKNAIKELYQMVSLIHKGADSLKKTGANFVPNSDINHTGLLVEIPDILLKHFPNDSLVFQQSSSFYKMGLQQFKNCYEGEEFSNKLKNYYNLTIGGLLKTKRLGFGSLENDEIVNAIENIENRLAWKEFIYNRNYSKTSIPDSIIKKDFILRKQLVFARKNNDSLLVLELENQIKTYKTFLTKIYPVISKSILSKFKVNSFQERLKHDEVVFRYKIIKKNLYVFKITQNNIEIKLVEYLKNFKDKLIRYIQLLKNIDENKVISQEIFKKLFPFNLNNYNNIIIIPDGILYHLPFESLLINEEEYLIKNHVVSYASDLIFTKTKDFNFHKENDLQLFLPTYDFKDSINNKYDTNQLKGAKEEAFFIAKLFNSELYTGQLATKSNFFKNIQRASLVHLAMHAEIDNEKPELSYFLFGNSTKENLYLEELYALKLNAKLAVLSACNTGTGSLSSNKGAVSLQRAFTFAGIPATISSLWKVPDKETSQIMRLFYTHLKNGKTKSKALQLAKKEYLETTTDPFLLHPYYWAGFVLNGNTEAIVSEPNVNKYAYLVLLLVFSIVLLLVFRKKLIKVS
ncbi:CHAT domain-containing protein [Tenacibaculum halocynthiae]|uniref:CHAT domain-containing protein n=1 Tax=Tenacibaculum halocynthiae TaxID=1254437 RepID=UPI0038B606A4